MNSPRVYNVWWTIPQSIVIPVEQAHTVLERYGFEKQDMPAPSAKLAISRTAHSFQDRRHKANRRVTEKTADNGRYVTYGLLSQKRVSDEEVSFEQDTTIRFDKQSETFEAQGPLAADFQSRHSIYRNSVTSEDISAFLRRIIAMSMGIPKRPTGGIYFIPSHLSWMIENGQKVLDDLHSKAKLYLEGVMDGEQERENLWGSVQGEIENRISDVLKSVERIEKRASAIKKHDAKLSELEKLREVYVGLLGEEAQHEVISERLADAVKTVSEKLNALHSDKKPKKSGTRKSKIFEAAVEVLKFEDRKMSYREIADLALAAGLYESKCKNPHDNMNSAITKAILNGDSRVVRISRGVYQYAV